MALTHADTGNLQTDTAFSGEQVGGFVGLCLILYMGNVYMVEVARQTLPADPDGSALIRGCALGTVFVTVIAAGWLVATSAALEPAQLEGEVGTVIGPLADETGMVVTVLGAVLTVLLLGLGIERASVAVMHLIQERVPSRPVLPVLVPLVICLVGEALLAADAVSFAGVFNAAGIASNVVLGLALPFLLVAAGRRTGDVEAGLTVPLAGRRSVATVMVLADAALLVALATVLSDGAVLQVVALGALGALGALVYLGRP